MTHEKSVRAENAISRDKGAERIRTAESDRSADLGGTTPDEYPRPDIAAACFVCRVTEADIERNCVIVSPRFVAHHGADGRTACGNDATGDRWWWPL